MDELSYSNLQDFIDIIVNKGGYKTIIEGLQNTLIIAIVGMAVGTVIGTLIATIRVLPKYSSTVKALDKACSLYVGAFRGTPMVVQLVVCYYVILPIFEVNLDRVIVATIVFALNSGAYISEIMRGGILSVDPGQMEGGRSVGMSYGATMMKIVIPQAVKNILPTMGNEFITLVKETSVVSLIGAKDLYMAFYNFGTSSYRYMLPFLSMAVIYVILICIITVGIKFMERRLRKSDR